jgi:polyhydroxyalkanoate synthesis regulator phasin
LIGLGLLAVSTSKLVSRVNELIEKNQVNKKEGERMIRMLKQEGLKRRREVEDLVKNELKGFYKSVFVSRKDFEVLEKRVLKLEKSLVKRSSGKK